MAKGKPAKTDAQKAAKWIELAEKRADKIVKGIESLGKLSAKARYSYTSKQIETLKGAFEDALNDCFARYEGQVAKRAGVKL